MTHDHDDDDGRDARTMKLLRLGAACLSSSPSTIAARSFAPLTPLPPGIRPPLALLGGRSGAPSSPSHSSGRDGDDGDAPPSRPPPLDSDDEATATTMSDGGEGGGGRKPLTTNAEDLREAAALRARLSARTGAAAAPRPRGGEGGGSVVPSVSLDPGAHKYVLVTADPPPGSGSDGGDGTKTRTFVYSRRTADYHREVAEELVPLLEAGGYRNVRIRGGGRILRDDADRRINIFGYSYGFGRADHSMAKRVVEGSGTFDGYEVTWCVSTFLSSLFSLVSRWASVVILR